MPRDIVFISHANPGDNTFTQWLGGRLSAAGYTVWADILNLWGGEDWQRGLEDAIRKRAFKVLVVCTSEGVTKQGVRNEIQIAQETGKNIADKEFVIPLRLERYETPFTMAHAQYIDFGRGWKSGFSELVETLDQRYKAPKAKNERSQTIDTWLNTQTRYARHLVNTPEKLISNWVRITEMPRSICLYDFAGRKPEEVGKELANLGLPAVEYNEGILSWSSISEMRKVTRTALGVTTRSTVSTEAYLEEGWPNEGIEQFDARRHVSNLARQCVEGFLRERGLSSHEMATGSLAWWGSLDLIPDKQIGFEWTGEWKGRRSLCGYSEKRGVYWHYGISPIIRIVPERHIRIKARVIFSEDGKSPLNDRDRMHRLRRSFTRSWRNDRWRDLLLTFLHWLGEGSNTIEISRDGVQCLKLRLPPIEFEAPFSVASDVGDGQTSEEEIPETATLEDYQDWDEDEDPVWEGSEEEN